MKRLIKKVENFVSSDRCWFWFTISVKKFFSIYIIYTSGFNYIFYHRRISGLRVRTHLVK